MGVCQEIRPVANAAYAPACGSVVVQRGRDHPGRWTAYRTTAVILSTSRGLSLPPRPLSASAAITVGTAMALRSRSTAAPSLDHVPIRAQAPFLRRHAAAAVVALQTLVGPGQRQQSSILLPLPLQPPSVASRRGAEAQWYASGAP